MKNFFKDGCSTCTRYSRAYGRCLDGHVNPHNLARTREVMSSMGYSYICNRNAHKRKALEMNRRANRNPMLRKEIMVW